ncbi:MAG: EamA family transporter [Proteobacteria bacterium]|nr:EamA family transporter [Pseudomonadota bacterium]
MAGEEISENTGDAAGLPNTRKRIYGYICGILSGVMYGTNPLFGLPLMKDYGLPVESVLFYRYGSAALCMLVWVMVMRARRRERSAFEAQPDTARAKFGQAWRLFVLGIFFCMSSLFLFSAYHYIPSGIATTIIYVEPVLVALIMVFLKEYPSWQKWVAIAVSFAGVVLLCHQDGPADLHWQGIVLAFLSALSYAFYLVIVNCSKAIRTVSESVLGLVTLFVGAAVFLVQALVTSGGLSPIPNLSAFGLVMGLGLLPTIGSLVTMTYATRTIGATTTVILGVLEPVTAICVGVCLFHEPLTAYILAGFVLIAGAIGFMTWSDRR